VRNWCERWWYPIVIVTLFLVCVLAFNLELDYLASHERSLRCNGEQQESHTPPDVFTIKPVPDEVDL